jgi:hypothetical protein
MLSQDLPISVRFREKDPNVHPKGRRSSDEEQKAELEQERYRLRHESKSPSQ